MNETIDINPKKQLLTVQNLNLTRGTFQLKDISFSVYSNEILAIIGKTGSGKTLLLESIAGFQKLDSGKILLREHSLEDYSLQERKLGYLYQEYCLFQHMTARENIAYGLKILLINGCLRGIVDSDKLFTSNWDEDVNYFLGKREHHDQKRIV